MLSSQKGSHRPSVLNRPIDNFTALMATVFVNMSTFLGAQKFTLIPERVVVDREHEIESTPRRDAVVQVLGRAHGGEGGGGGEGEGGRGRHR